VQNLGKLARECSAFVSRDLYHSSMTDEMLPYHFINDWNSVSYDHITPYQNRKLKEKIACLSLAFYSYQIDAIHILSQPPSATAQSQLFFSTF